MLPILTLTISVVRRVEKATIGKILGLILSIIGIAFTVNLNHFSISQSSLKGDFILLLGTTFWSAYYSFGKEFLQKYDNLWITTWMFFISGIVLLVLNLNKFMNFIIPEMTPELVGSILFTILGATGLAYYLTNTTLKKLPATISALAVYIQPVVAGIIGVIFLKESITLNTVIGDLLIIAGVLVAAFYKPKAVSTPVQN
jgi:drug/metabolite transporter (DMT)-like permease